ncbi:MAG: TlyA family RNA methyltransferase [Oscillospiraceae bacterium]
MRIDCYLVENKIVKSRERAKEHIKNGDVFINGRAVFKPSVEVTDDDNVEFRGAVLKYVGRGGLKLEKAVDVFGIDLNGKICMDIGASTGGFTDCMLQNGAEYVYAVDVGHGQLDEKLCADKRVCNMEKTNFTELFPENFDPYPNFFSVDVSFVSLKKIIPKLSEFMKDGSMAAVLIKPQFEAGKSDIGKNGIVKDRKVHLRVLNELTVFFSQNGLAVKALDFSPISGGDGNIEYLSYIVRSDGRTYCIDIESIIDEAFLNVRRKDKT